MNTTAANRVSSQVVSAQEGIYTRTRNFYLILFLLIFSYVLFESGWLSDDSFITLRTVDNSYLGYGWRWNIIERVQAYTHPLWFLLLLILRAVVEDHFVILFGLGIACSLFSLYLALGLTRSLLGALCLMFLALGSKAFVDYSTSGLENPLLHLLLAAFFCSYIKDKGEPERQFLLLTTFLSLGYLTRQDSVLLFLPAYLGFLPKLRGIRFFKIAKLGILGTLPAIIWSIFSVFYYGFPFPNTAYAKLAHGIPSSHLRDQGFYYLSNSLSWDPLTLSVIVFGAILALFTRSYRQALFCAGALLYLGYVVYVGGDYMSGRFLSAPFFLVVLALLSMQLGWSYILFSVFGLLALAFGPRSVLLMAEPYVCRIEDNWRIADQRIRYGPWTSPRAYLKNGRSNTHFLQMRGIELKDNSNKVIRSKAIGMQGVVLGPERTIIDPYALADPLLARLPISHPHKWRIGHFNRAMPDGYIESLETLENRILDPALHEYYDKLSLIVRGDLFSLQRLKTIVAFNLGRYEPLRLAYVSRMNRPTQNGVRRRLSVPALGARGLSCSL